MSNPLVDWLIVRSSCGRFITISLIAAVPIISACSSSEPASTPAAAAAAAQTSPAQTASGQAVTPPTDPARRAIYDQAATILGDGSLSYSDRRNHLRVLRRGVGDARFFEVIRDVPVYDAKTGATVAFSRYMADLAGTYISDPEAPISFDPVGAAMQIVERQR